jgi:hypothetical protein
MSDIKPYEYEDWAGDRLRITGEAGPDGDAVNLMILTAGPNEGDDDTTYSVDVARAKVPGLAAACTPGKGDHLMDSTPWWRSMPPCPRCEVSHVLIDCTKRLPFDAGRSAS